VIIPIVFPTGDIVQVKPLINLKAGINIRPYAAECL
jgi:hypothetical protein